MGNYNNLEVDFIRRTLNLISQYESSLHRYPFERQYNYTLLINCLLGVVVMPKERTISHIPTSRINTELKRNMGLNESSINPSITNLRELIVALRHSIAHFDLNLISNDSNSLIDEIIFNDSHNNIEIVRFRADELLPFIRYYSDWIISNLETNRNN